MQEVASRATIRAEEERRVDRLRAVSTRGPRSLPARIEDPERTPYMRHLTCEYYDGCLEDAIEREWRSFHCRLCRHFIGG